ncbi:Hypothetical protein CINCED_3A012212 [Cinara cedri]|uniref:Uncharacterized protein n=1 Tax=Cinara cedri TaxID=506608 RepID=A0A5E4N6S3_9HEMI|nr:Hypothetical protein CINCED_3A012212 [Cinara cedri]
MYKIVFLVAVFAFAIQGAFSVPATDSKLPESAVDVNPEILPKSAALASGANEETTQGSTVSPATTPKTSGASSSEICVLLVQISSLALVAKHMLL